jgi:RNA polymerase sigma factor, sigma-70 family
LERDTEFELFFKQNYSRFYYFAFQMIGDKEVCRDIVSDGFEQTWPIFEQSKKINWTSYMYALIRNKCVDYLRREMVKTKYADFYMAMYDEADEGDGYEEMEEQITQMYKMISEFSPKTRLVLEECYFHRKKYSEVAEELGISVSAVRKHIVNALKEFRKEIAKKV